MSQRKLPTIPAQSQVPLSDIARIWWPLAVSWLFMSIEGPAHSAVVTRLANPEIHLAAWGGIVFPISLLIESPIVMMLSASTALSKDWDAYKKLRRFMVVLGAILSLIHISIAFTPLYYFVARVIIGAPEAIIEPGRIGLMIMTPWAWSIGYRRLQQGVMIRFGHARAVGAGTIVRLLSNAVVLICGYLLKTIPGIVVASSAVATGVIAEAIFAGVRTRTLIHQHIMPAPRHQPVLTLASFLKFYVPLATTTTLSFFVSSLGSAAMSRMPNPLTSLAAWPVIYGLMFVLRSPCLAFNEVVIAVIDRPRAIQNLRRFARLLALGSTALALILAATPLADFWLGRVMALPPTLLQVSRIGLWLAIFIPLFALLQSWFQGIIVSSQKTRGVTEAVILYIAIIGLLLTLGINMQSFTGLFVVVMAYEIAGLGQSIWLWLRSRPAVASMAIRGVKSSGTLTNPGEVL